MKNEYKPELLAPAGSMENLMIALENGCDAVYCGIQNYSARQNAANFTLAQIKEALTYCRLRDVKLYVTLNIVMKDHELKTIRKLIENLYVIGIDGIIVQDIGLAHLVKRYFPELPIHGSTQMTVQSLDGASFLFEAGFNRIVLARELHLNQIQRITKHSNAYVECFIHGALCYSYSGQCLISSFNGGRSGNRGYCAQNCRLPYTLCLENKQLWQGHLMSCKDLQTLDLLPSLINAGIHAFKIEGRLKSGAYVAVVTRIYRKYIDRALAHPDSYEVEPDDAKALLQVFNRGGFTTGYYQHDSGRKMLTLDHPPRNRGLKIGQVIASTKRELSVKLTEAVVAGDGFEISQNAVSGYIQKEACAGSVIKIKSKASVALYAPVNRTYGKALMDQVKQKKSFGGKKRMITGQFIAAKGQPIRLVVTDKEGHTAVGEGASPQEAIHKPITIERLNTQLKKTADTPFAFRALTIQCADQLFINLADINELRRRTLNNLAVKITEAIQRAPLTVMIPETGNTDQRAGERRFSVYVKSQEQLEAALLFSKIERIYIDCYNEALIKMGLKTGKAIFGVFPRTDMVFTDNNYGKHKLLNQAQGFLVRTYGQMHNALLYCAPNKTIVADYTLHTANAQAISFWQKKHVAFQTLSPELTLHEMRPLINSFSEVIVYGKLPLMLTKQCPIGIWANKALDKPYCKFKNSSKRFTLIDKEGQKLTLWPDCRACTCEILGEQPIGPLSIQDLPDCWLRLQLTDEDFDLACSVIGHLLGTPSGKMPVTSEGHFYKDVK